MQVVNPEDTGAQDYIELSLGNGLQLMFRLAQWPDVRIAIAKH